MSDREIMNAKYGTGNIDELTQNAYPEYILQNK